MSYQDLRQFLFALTRHGLLRHVSTEVDKDWEISAITRWIYQGYNEENRYAVLFDKVKGHSMSVVVGAVGGSYRTYALGLGIDPAGSKAGIMRQIRMRWADALAMPIKPVTVSQGPCQENVFAGKGVNLHQLPVPVWTPGKDGNWEKGLGFLTSPCHITRDPDTGTYNMGTYRSMVREKPNEMAINFSIASHMQTHLKKNEARGRRTEVATVLGPDPAVMMASVTRVPENVDELAVAGALRGAPVEMVKCRTIDLEVPATAEIVIEGSIPLRSERPFELEGPFGEVTGYQGSATYSPVCEISCITYRNNPIYQAFVSQMPPSESSKVRQIGLESLTLKELAKMNTGGIEDINMPEGAQGRFIVASIKKKDKGHPERVARAIFKILQPRYAKMVIVTDDDVDIYDLDNLIWAITFRTSLTPDRRGVHFIEGLSATALDYSAAPSLREELDKRSGDYAWPGVGVFIDATRPYEPYPVVSLPAAKYLEKARDSWQEYGLPRLEKDALPRTVVVEEEYLQSGKVTTDLRPRQP